MFLDFADPACQPPERTDLCLVGAGVMGLAITQHLLARSPRPILLVEEGELNDSEATSAVAAETNGGDLPSAVAGSRFRGFGGSSRRWGGQALPFSPLDLDDRPFLPERGGWPISWEELNRHYPAVDHFLGLSDLPFEADLWQRPAVRDPFRPGRDLELTLSKYSPHAYLAAVHREAIARSSQVSCLLNARVATLVLDPEGGWVRGVRLRNRQGREVMVAAHEVVLCAGGIENARILLSTKQQPGHGLLDPAGLVGTHYHDHVGFFAAQLLPRQWRHFRHLFASFRPGERQKYVPKLQLSAALRQREELLAVIGNLDVQEHEHGARPSARRIYHSLRQGFGAAGGGGDASGAAPPRERASLRDGLRLLRAAPESAAMLRSHLLEGRIALPRSGRFFLMANAEAEPLPHSRLRLGDERDAHGLERVVVEWRLSERTGVALRRYAEALREGLEGAGIATVRISDYLLDPEVDWKQRAYSLYHHMGATRMAASPSRGVVDGDGRVHGIANLHVAGTSVLPTGSGSNPSYTALALALRTAGRILARG